MTTCTGCNCHSPTESFDVDQFGAAKHPGCNNDIGDEGTTFDGQGLPCGFVMLSGYSCSLPWWKHGMERDRGNPTAPRTILVPPTATYEGPYAADAEPSAMYPATFLGKECVHGTCVYVQKEGVNKTDAGCSGYTNPYTRCCNIESYTGGTTGRDPYKLDDNGKMVQPWPMLFDLRKYESDAAISALFAGVNGLFPNCCWCRPDTGPFSRGGDPLALDACEINWDGWMLFPTGSPDPYFLGGPRISYQEGNDAFWEAVGKPRPYYREDSTWLGGAFQAAGATQFGLQNADYWLHLPTRICVVPIRWPYHNSPCDSLSNTLTSCAPAEHDYGSVSNFNGCETGLSIAVEGACNGSDVELTITVRSAGCGNHLVPSFATRNVALPSGVTSPDAVCDYWWNVASANDCDFGVLTYWTGSLWKNSVWKSTDSGATYTSAGDATIVGSPECGCAGVSFTAEFVETSSSCCDLCGDCTPLTDLTLEVTAATDDCACALGEIHSLVYQGETAGQHIWHATGDHLCTTGGSPAFVLTCEVSGGQLNLEISCSASGATLVSQSCSPFTATFEATLAQLAGCCDPTATGSGPETVTFVIT